MTDRVYPASKPNPPAINGGGGGVGSAPATANGTKPNNPYNTNRPISRPYRPHQPPPPRRKRSCSCSCSCSPRKCCCLCFIYTLIFLLCLLLLAAIAACIFYFLYRPKHPTFTVVSAKISSFNLTSSSDNTFSHLDSKIDFVLAAKNPNQRIYFLYDQLQASASASGVTAGNATVPAFQHSPANTTIIRASIVADPNKDIDSDTVGQLNKDLGNKGGFPITVQVDTMVRVRMGKLNSNKVGIRVVCQGIKGSLPKKTTLATKKKAATTTKITPAMALTSDAKCKVDVRIKIWKFTF